MKTLNMKILNKSLMLIYFVLVSPLSFGEDLKDIYELALNFQL